VLGCSGRRATGDRWATTGAGAEKGKETTVQVVMSTKTPSAGGVGSAAAEESSNKERGEAGDGAEAGAGKTGVEAVSTTASPSAGGKGESPRKEEGKAETLSFSLPTADGKEGSSVEAGKSQAVSSPAELITESPSAEGVGEDGAAQKQTKITGRGPKPKKREGEHWSRIYECPTCGLRLARWKRMQHHLKTQKHIRRLSYPTWEFVRKNLRILNYLDDLDQKWVNMFKNDPTSSKKICKWKRKPLTGKKKEKRLVKRLAKAERKLEEAQAASPSAAQSPAKTHVSAKTEV